MKTPALLPVLALSTACRVGDVKMLMDEDSQGLITMEDLAGGGSAEGISPEVLEANGIPVGDLLSHYRDEIRLVVDPKLTGTTPLMDVGGLPAELLAFVQDVESGTGQNEVPDDGINDQSDLDEEAIAPQIIENEIQVGEDVWCRSEQEIFIQIPYMYGVLEEVSMDPECCARVYAFWAFLNENSADFKNIESDDLSEPEQARWTSLAEELNGYEEYMDVLVSRCDEL